jgi:hypothetical protein
VELPLVVEKLEALPDNFRVLEGEDPECQAVIRDFLLGMERQERGAARSVSITCVHKITNDREREHVYEEKKVRRRRWEKVWRRDSCEGGGGAKRSA